MNFCAKCGRERSGDARYCGGCGTEFAAAPAPAVTPPTDDTAGGVLPPSATAEAQVPADATRIERQPDVTMIDRPRSAAESARAATPAKAEPDPFAAWFAPDAPPAPRTEPAGQWQAAPEPWQADTVYAGQRDPVYPAPSQPGPAYPPPYGAQPTPPSGGGRSSGGRKAAFIVVVVLVMIAAGGGAYALVSRSSKGSTTQPPASPTAASPAASTARSSASASTSPSASASATPSASASGSVSASASPTASLVAVDPGLASNPAEPAVETTLSHYFHGINTHDYAEYQSAHNAQTQASESQSAFNSGYGSTTDSDMTLTSLEAAANGDESATVTFTSRQAASASVDGSTCNDWKLTYYLVPAGTGYLIGPPPSGYQPAYTDC
jgi:hypothetical protein